MNTKDSIIDSTRIEQAIQQRYSPFPSMTMELLSSQLNSFRIGELRPAARTWEIMMERDGDLAVPADKLFSDIARLPWDYETEEESIEADAHAAAIRYFCEHLTARNVLDNDEIGGQALLLRQMMTAHAYRYSIHEMVLQINSAGKKEATATFNHCPVWFFEARRGKLGFLKREFDIYGEPLEAGAWLPAVGRGMMRQCSVAYITKWRPLADWMLFSYRFGIPGIHGETSAQKGSTEWNDFTAALSAFANDWVTATSGQAGSNKINLIEAAKGGTGTLPFQDLVERSDRLYARAFRGGDLSTQSREGGDVAGANPQEGEKSIVLEDGGQWATDVLNARVVEPLIAYLFNTTPKAWICIRPPKQLDATREINALKAARELNVPVSIDTARERLELPAPKDGEELISAPPDPAPGLNSPSPGGEGRDEGEPPDDPALANATNLTPDTSHFAQALSRQINPVLGVLDRISQIQDDAQMLAALQNFLAQSERFAALATADTARVAAAIEKITAGAFVAGLQGKQP